MKFNYPAHGLTDGTVEALGTICGSGPEYMTPSQWSDRHRQQDTPYAAERRMWLAALEDAVSDIQETCRCAKHTRLRLAALEWVMDDSEAICSFRWYCLSLGFDADAVRLRLLKAVPSQPPEPVGVPVDDWNGYMRAYRRARPEVREYNRRWMARRRSI